jgi:cell division septation protein DedD
MKRKVVEKGKDSKRNCKLSKVIACSTAVLIVSVAIAFMSLVVAPVLDIENGFRGNSTAEEIPAEGVDAEIKVGTGKKEKEEESPGITAWEPMEEVVSSVEGESVTFEILVDQTVDISWQINGTEVKTDEGVTESSFRESAVAGTWNVLAIATSTETGLSSMHTWIWSVRPTSTEVPEETPTPTLAPRVTPTATPTAPPEEATPTTPIPKPPGFEVVFAIAVLTAIAYMLLRKR